MSPACPALVVFGLGALLIVFTFYYIPARQKLDKASAGIEYADAVARQLAGQHVQRERSHVNEEKSGFVD